LRSRPLLVLLLLGLCIAIGLMTAGCGGSSKKAATLHPDSDGCDHSKPAAASDTRGSYSRPETVLKPGQKAEIDMLTSCGTVTIQLDRDPSNPIPNSIAFLVGKKFYDGLTFHRIIQDFVLQGGDPKGNGTGDPGYTVAGKVPTGYHYKLGDFAMAKTQVESSGTAGSQFFVISGAQGVALPTLYGVLGHAADRKSLLTIERIAKFATQATVPAKPIYIWTAKLVRES
jgi:peptidyl-prolyl cis-trans isomerase B (cyclophilin B)